MNLAITLLTGILVLDCLFLILLILVQLPKKEAGLGQAFGNSTTDALFGAGSGNALTKLTKYSAGVFFFLALTLSWMNSNANSSKGTLELEQGLGNKRPLPVAAPIAKPADLTAPGTNTGGLTVTPQGTNSLQLKP